jgi:hypothetical protein
LSQFSFFVTLLIQLSLCFLLFFFACICLNHNVLLEVRAVGLLFALKMAILGSVWLWTGLALETLIFWHD